VTVGLIVLHTSSPFSLSLSLKDASGFAKKNVLRGENKMKLAASKCAIIFIAAIIYRYVR
jgi:hypothetical protein